MKKSIFLLGLVTAIFLVLTGCDMTKIDGFAVVDYIDSDVKNIGNIYKYDYEVDSFQNDVRRYEYKQNGKEEDIYTVLFKSYKCSVTDISANDGLFLIVSNPSDKSSMEIRLELFDANDNDDSAGIETGLMDFAGNIIKQPQQGFVTLPAGFYGVIYCPFDDNSSIMNILHPDQSYQFGFSLKAPKNGEAESIDVYSALMYKYEGDELQTVSLDNTDIEYGALKTLQDFEGALDSDFIKPTSGINTFISNFDGGVYSGKKSLLIINCSNNNQSHLYEFTDSSSQPVIQGSSLSGLDFRKNGVSPQGMYFLISVPDDYSSESRDTDEINVILRLKTSVGEIEIPSNAMSLYREDGSEKGSISAGGIDIPMGFSGIVYVDFSKMTLPDGWNWSSVDVSLELTGIKYSQTGHVAYNYRDILIDDFTAVYDKEIPSSIKFQQDSVQSAYTGEEFRRPVSVRVTDSEGNPVEGVEVTFSFPEGGASAIPESYTAISSASGIAEVRIRANEYAGSYEVTASVGDLKDVIRLNNNEAVSESETGDDSAGVSTGFTALHAVGVLILLVIALSISLISVYNKNKNI